MRTCPIPGCGERVYGAGPLCSDCSLLLEHKLFLDVNDSDRRYNDHSKTYTPKENP
jgi:hypothetical protein